MKWFNNLRVSFKVIFCSMILILFTCTMGIISMRSSDNATRIFEKFFYKEFMPIRYVNGIARNMLQMRINMLVEMEALKTKDFTEVEKRINDSTELASENEEQWKKYKDALFSVVGRKLADEWDIQYRITEDMRGRYEKAIVEKRFDDAVKYSNLWLTEYRKSRDKTEKLVQSKMGFAEQDMLDQKNEAHNEFIINISILAASLFFGILITVMLARSVSGPVKKGLVFAQKIANGDFTDRIDLDQKDELGQLSKALNTAADDLEKMVADIIVGTQNLVQAIQEISSGNENLSQRTTEQASSLEEVASTIEETTASINQNAENAKEANTLSNKTMKMAEDGGRVVYGAVSAINEINDASKKIESIISVINEISFQTNLLALNAAVEAARAGEQGRGFAVVAGEVRNLAQRSGSAAKEIGELIKSTIVKVEKGTALANQSGEALKEIIGSVQTVGRFVSEIDSSSEEQKQGASQINIAVSELDSMTQQNAGLVEETASASEEMANQAQELLGTMDKFKIRQQRKETSYSSAHKEIHLRTASMMKGAQGKSLKREAVKRADSDRGNGANGSGVSPAVYGKAGGEIEKILSQDGFEQF
jgi:methyl-accepting chemotaxis protein